MRQAARELGVALYNVMVSTQFFVGAMRSSSSRDSFDRATADHTTATDASDKLECLIHGDPVDSPEAPS
jgi:hypothetical protein